ncbi:MAG: hypothetical protein IT269_10770, partial [Saprospiraceae bacterium]|nr:hypothetical protein [Saprospiraceae bacterium]
AQSIISYALRAPESLPEGSPEHLEAINSLLDIQWYSTVGQAVAALEASQDMPFDLAFVDIDFSKTDDLESDARFAGFPANRRGLELLRVLRHDFPLITVKVQTRYGTTKDVHDSLQAQAIELEDIYDLMGDGDLIAVRQNLANIFPGLLRSVAQQRYYYATENPALRPLLNAEIQQAAAGNALERPLQLFGGITLRALLAGWATARPGANDEGFEVVLPGQLNPALEALQALRGPDGAALLEFAPAGNLRQGDPQQPRPGYARLMALRASNDYLQIRERINADALTLICAMLGQGWRNATEGMIANNTIAPFVFPPHLIGLDDNLGQVIHGQEPYARHALIRVLICRAVVLGVYALRNSGHFFQHIPTTRTVELALFAVILNDPPVMNIDNQERVDNYFNIRLGLRKQRRQPVIINECILPEEHHWMNNLITRPEIMAFMG